MANCFWPEEYAQFSQNGGLFKDDTFSAPWQLPNDVAAAQYHCFTPATVEPPQYEVAEGDRAASACRSHSEAEKRRRERINAQFSTLRKLIPKSEKMDKASLLGHVVDHVKELRKKAKEVSKTSTIPSEIDEVAIDYLNEEETNTQNNENVYLKASVCCDDRPELFAELNSAFASLELIILQADMSNLGGRMKANFVLCARECGTRRNYCNVSIKQSINLALSRVVISSSMSSYGARSKRQRFFCLEKSYK